MDESASTRDSAFGAKLYLRSHLDWPQLNLEVGRVTMSNCCMNHTRHCARSI